MEEQSELEDEQKVGGTMQTAKDLFAGAMGGIAQVLIGQPFDIVKVRLQTTTQYSSAIDCASQIWKAEGPLAFYKGTLTPLIGIGACEKQLSLGQYYASGAFAGVLNSVLSGPIEHVRIRLQTQPHAPTRSQLLYPNPWSCIRTLIARGGVANGLYRGQAVTILREAQAYGSWFLTYEYLMAHDVARRGLSGRNEVEAWRLALYGGIAGEVLWLSSYPLDVVKSKMQTDGLGVSNPGKEASENPFGVQRYHSMRNCFSQTWKLEGVRGFWRGILPTMVRAMPVSAATFAVAEMTLRLVT